MAALGGSFQQPIRRRAGVVVVVAWLLGTVAGARRPLRRQSRRRHEEGLTTTTQHLGHLPPPSGLSVVLSRRGGSFEGAAPAGALPKISEERATRAFATAMERVEPLLLDVEMRLRDGASFDGVLGVKADEIYALGVATFDDATEGNDATSAKLLFEQALDARLELLFVKHLSAVRAKLLAAFKAGEQTPEEVDREFKSTAEAAKRTGATWSYEADRTSLKAVLLEMKQRADRVTSVNAKAATQQQSYMQLFQTYQAQIQQLQQAVAAAPAAASLAYRVPDTDFAVTAKKEQDKTTLSVGCVPDDSAPLLGVNGFVKGVTPFNVGLTINLHV